ncbi:TPA: hypothetical protein ACHQP2_001408 [Pseudomonas aeruginosa]|uniref:hypothetical protein n=1 Tax=Pseudomonas TaxID=286 RepID=UPI00053EC1AD|nr:MULTISPECIES: hypothetical protein [Pseudomonas]EIU1437377.1 hypothetical protein [Pseudomonas aeruginosa]EKU4051565.1 hypothetical protein [Pseudomonas aeruginosa]EKX7956449.1 hypothetical protein [Pseudomonas aeruginosa]EKX9337981.1 hypothetical protein [Pseudomonas aeruginosa]MBH3462121.1 hypothetical protein [Pseudomonas putida]
MKRPAPILPDHPMYTDAVDAFKRYHQAQHAGAPSEEVEQLRQHAEFLFQSVTDYQLHALKGQPFESH